MAKIVCTLSTKVDKQTGKSEILLRLQDRKIGNRRAHSRIWILPKFMNTEKGEIEIKARKLTPEVKDAFEQKGQLEKLKSHIIISEQNIHSEDANELFEVLVEKFGEDVYSNPVTGAGIMGGYYGDETIALEGLQKREATVVNVIPSYFVSYSHLVETMLYPVEIDTLIRESFLEQALQAVAEEVTATKIHNEEM